MPLKLKSSPYEHPCCLTATQKGMKKGDNFKGSQKLKVVYPNCCGVDVHKTFFIATIITTEKITPHY